MFGGLKLLVREGTKVDKSGGINGDGVIENCAKYLLHEVDGLRGEQGGVVCVFGVLYFGAVGGRFTGMEGIMWERWLGVL